MASQNSQFEEIVYDDGFRFVRKRKNNQQNPQREFNGKKLRRSDFNFECKDQRRQCIKRPILSRQVIIEDFQQPCSEFSDEISAMSMHCLQKLYKYVKNQHINDQTTQRIADILHIKLVKLIPKILCECIQQQSNEFRQRKVSFERNFGNFYDHFKQKVYQLCQINKRDLQLIHLNSYLDTLVDRFKLKKLTCTPFDQQINAETTQFPLQQEFDQISHILKHKYDEQIQDLISQAIQLSKLRLLRKQQQSIETYQNFK